MNFAEQWWHCMVYTCGQLASRAGLKNPYEGVKLPVQMSVEDMVRELEKYVRLCAAVPSGAIHRTALRGVQLCRRYYSGVATVLRDEKPHHSSPRAVCGLPTPERSRTSRLLRVVVCAIHVPQQKRAG